MIPHKVLYKKIQVGVYGIESRLSPGFLFLDFNKNLNNENAFLCFGLFLNFLILPITPRQRAPRGVN